MEIKDYIRVYQNVLRPEVLNALVKTFEDQTFKQAKVVYSNGQTEVDKSYRDVKDLLIHDKTSSLTMTHWKRYLDNKIANQVLNYCRELKLDITPNKLLETTILKYTEGGHYRRHYDSSANTPREFSVIIMLNDNYEGGSLKFFEGEKVIREVKPKTGNFIVWPSNFLYPHQAMPVIKGTRYVLVAWAN